MIELTCPRCGVLLQFDEEEFGQTRRCSSCSEEVVVMDPDRTSPSTPLPELEPPLAPPLPTAPSETGGD